MLDHALRVFLLFAVLTPGAAAAQTASAPQAATLLVQSVNAALGPAGTAAVNDFTMTGTITYFWAGDKVPGSGTLRGRGADQFRLDAILPGGTRSYAFSHGASALKDTDGSLNSIPYHNTVNLSPLSFPYLAMAAAMASPSTTLSYLGLVTDDTGRQLYQVRVQRNFPAVVDPDGTLASLCVTDYFIDPQTFLAVKTPLQRNAEAMMASANSTNYTYDGDRKRVKKSNGTLYWYGTNGEILEETDLSGNLLHDYIYFGGRRIARQDGFSGTSLYYYFQDHLGTAPVTQHTGAVLEAVVYYPWGGV